MDLPKVVLSKVAHFFTHYKDTEEDKWVKVLGFQDRDYAMSLINNARIKE